jgi:hypothetical protein
MEQIYRKINDCFKRSDTIRPDHLLYKDFLQERTDISKFIFYIWVQKNELKARRGKADSGDLGHGLEYIPAPQPKTN